MKHICLIFLVMIQCFESTPKVCQSPINRWSQTGSFVARRELAKLGEFNNRLNKYHFIVRV